VNILPFLTTFTQLTARLKNFLRGWLLLLGLNEGLVECVTVWVKSEVILNVYILYILSENCHLNSNTIQSSRGSKYAMDTSEVLVKITRFIHPGAVSMQWTRPKGTCFDAMDASGNV
jgi:hypothetical protein